MNFFRRLLRLFWPKRTPLYTRRAHPVDVEAALDFVLGASRTHRRFLVVASTFQDLHLFAERCNRLGRPAFVYRSEDLRQMVQDLRNPQAIQVICANTVSASIGWRVEADMDVIVLSKVSPEMATQIRHRVQGRGMFYAPALNQIGPLPSRSGLCTVGF